MGDQPYQQPYQQPPVQPQSAGAKWGPTSIGSLEAHVAAGLSYLTPIAGIVFFLLEKSNRFVKFHAMQSIILGVGYVAWIIIITIIQTVISTGTSIATNGASSGFGLSCLVGCLGWIVGLAFFGFWIWGIVSAFMGKYTKLPLFGALAEKFAGGPASPAY